MAALPKAVQQKREWQTAAEMLMLAAEGERPIMFAYIGMLQALHAGKPETPLEPRQKRAKKYRVIRSR